MKKMDRLWKDFFFTNKKELSKKDFVSMIKQRYESNTTAFNEMVRAFLSEWCEVIDLNGDTFLSEEEFLLNFAAEKHTNINQNKQVFYSMKPINGRVPNDAIIAYYFRYVSDPDKANFDIILDAINSGV
jgi:hypothetical protein